MAKQKPYKQQSQMPEIIRREEFPDTSHLPKAIDTTSVMVVVTQPKDAKTPDKGRELPASDSPTIMSLIQGGK